MTETLLRTKLTIPILRSLNLVPRPRLIEQINQGLQSGSKLILVSAPAGFGKSTLLSAWAQQAGLRPRIAWLSLDKADNDLTRFLTYFVAALQTIENSMGEGLLAALKSPGAVNTESLLTTLLNETTNIPNDVVLILDDYHVIESLPIDNALTFLLDNLPAQMHLAIATRTEPVLALSRLRARGQLTELREADLRFTSGEVTAFLTQVIRLPIPSDAVRTLEDRTEGWITGLQLAALAMQGLEQYDQITHFIDSFGGSHRYIIDYLVDEVLSQQTVQDQEFLLRTSILDRMVAPLCNIVASRKDSQTTLERLEAANLFLIPLDDERRWYRYHHLFADLLRQRLHQTQSELAPELHYQASEWYASHGFQFDAVQHALDGRDFERAADLIEANGLSLIGQGSFTAVQQWINSLPETVVRKRPYLCVYHAWASNFSHQLESIDPYLRDAQRALRALELPADDDTTRSLNGHIATLRAWNARRQHDNPLAISLLKNALDCLGDGNPFARTFADLNLGLAYMDEGELVKAADSFRNVVSQGDKSENELATLMATSHLAAVLILQGHLHEAEKLCRRTIRDQMQRHGKPPPTLCLIYIRLGWVLAEWNDVDGFFAHLSQGIILANQIGFDSVVTAASISMVWEKQLLAKQGAAIVFSDEVATIIDRAQVIETDVSSIQCSSENDTDLPEIEAQNVNVYLADNAYFEVWPGYSGHARARKLVEVGRVEEALDLLTRIREDALAVEGTGLIIEARSTEALIYQAQDELDHALDALEDALSLAEPQGYIRTFVDRDAPMAQLLAEAAARGIMPDYANMLLAAFNAGDQNAAQPLIEPLSPRELEVLQLIAQGLSNRQIGERLYLALSTVKGHNRNIFDKLQVQRRTEAVARARDLDLV